MNIRSGVSRWTMLHFGCAVAALLVAQALMVLGYSDPLSGLRAPATLIAVHLLTIGWLSLLMLGALYQFVPVITNTQLYSQRLPLYSLLAIVAGLAGMLAGFLAWGGVSSLTMDWLAVGGSLVLAGFVLGAFNLWATLWRVRPLPLPAGFVAFGLGFLLLTGLIGLGFALAFALAQAPGFLLALTSEGLSLHVAAGLGGWFTLIVIGVSYRLLSMFMLAPDEPHRTTYAALILTVTGLVVLIGAGLSATWTGAGAGWGKGVGAALTVVGVACYLVDIARFYRTRSRRHLELNSTTAAAALALITLALLAGALAAAWGELDRFAGAIGYLFVLGGLTGLGLSQLYKVVPFLTWLEVFGPKLGKGPVPRVQDLVNERRAMPWFALYFAAALLAAVCIALEQALWWRVTAGLQLLATLLIVIELWRAHHPDPDARPAPVRPPGMSALPAQSKPLASPTSSQRSTT